MNEIIQQKNTAVEGDILISWDNEFIWINGRVMKEIEDVCHNLKVKLIKEYLEKKNES